MLTLQQAVDASRQSKLVQGLLSAYPNAKATARSEERGGKQIWLIGWWTQARISSGLPYPDVIVYVDAYSGQILWDEKPKSGDYFEKPIFCDISASSADVDINKGEKTTIDVALSPVSPGTTVLIEYSSDGKHWDELAEGTTNAGGQYSHVWSPPVGTYYVRASWITENVGGMSSTLMITAVPEFRDVALALAVVLGVVVLAHRQHNSSQVPFK